MKNGFALPSFLSRGIRRSSLFSLSFGIALLFLMATTASAQNTLTVTGTGSGCTSTAASTYNCATLSDAITKSNSESTGTGDTINFASTVTGTITLGSALPTIQRSVTIEGPGANVLAISGAGSHQIFSITAAPVTISGLTLANGSVGSSGSGTGGAISYDDNGRLNVYSCDFTGNYAGFEGGAIYDHGGVLTVANSTFSGNLSDFLGGGAIVVAPLASNSAESLDVVNSTFFGNKAPSGSGGAIFSDINTPRTLTITNSTFVGNSASSSGGAIEHTGSGTVTVENSIFTGNSSTSNGAIHIGGVSLTEDHNLYFNNTGGAGIGTFGSGDVRGSNADPRLLPLGYYGDVMVPNTATETNGSTETMMPDPASPAIGAGSSAASGLPSTDQRGFPMDNTNVDIGAVQTNYIFVADSSGTATGSCPIASCTLPDAITQTDPSGGHDIDIGFAPTFFARPTITLSSALTLSQGDTVIIGPPPAVAISGSHTLIFDNSAGLALYGLTLENGRASAAGAIRNNSGGMLTVNNCTFAGNQVANNYSTDGGGAINNAGFLIVTDSTFYNNGGSGDYQGGAIYNQSGGTATVTSSTFSHNSAGQGGAIDNAGTLAFYDNIFADSTATQGAGHGGAIYNDGGSFTNDYNLFYGNDPGDGVGAGTHGLTGQDPKLLPLGHFGGPTETMMPKAGSGAEVASAAIGAGTSTLPFPVFQLVADQRGFPVTSTVDIGAVQTNYVLVTTDSGTATGSCLPTSCTLPDAINVANSQNYTDIGFSGLSIDPASPSTIDLCPSGSCSGSVALSLDQGNTVIVGPPDVVTISGGAPNSSDAQIFEESSSDTFLGLYGLTMANGLGNVNGGAVSNDGGTLAVTDCTFYDDRADEGGAIYNYGTATVTGSTFGSDDPGAGDYAVNEGGAIANDAGGTLTVTNSTFVFDGANNNTGGGDGGAIYSVGDLSDPATLNLTNNTFAANSAAGQGSAIYNDTDSTMIVADNIFFLGGYEFGNGDAIYNAGTMPTGDEDYNFFYGNAGGDTNFGYGANDVQAPSPPFPDPLGYPANNGGPTLTTLPLPSGATDGTPICRGTATLPGGLALPMTDQRGFPRLNTSYSGFSASSPCIDIGSVQTDFTSIQFTNGSSGYTASSTTTAASPAPNVTVTESGQSIGGVPVTLDLSPTPTTVTGDGKDDNPVFTALDGSGATFDSLIVSPGGTYTLSSTLDITPDISITTGSTPTLVVTGGSAVGTSTTLTAAPNPFPSGGEVTLTAVVTPDSGTTVPTGTVTFTVGTDTVDGTPEPCPSGTASYSLCATGLTGSLIANTSVEAGFSGTSGFADSNSDTVALTVETVTDYVDSLSLNSGQKHSLDREWNHAQQLAAKGNFNGAIGNLETFIAEVEDLYSSGLLTQDEATALIQAANYQIGLWQSST